MPHARRLSVTEATGCGLSRLLNDAASGTETIVVKHGRPVAAVVGTSRLNAIREMEDDLRSMLVVASRILTDDGTRFSLDDIAEELGVDIAAVRDEVSRDPDAVLAD